MHRAESGMLVAGESRNSLVLLASDRGTPVCYLLSFYFPQSGSFAAHEARSWSRPAKSRRTHTTSIPRLEAS